jgi:hypothetical protein
VILVMKINHQCCIGKLIAVCSEIHRKHINTLCGQNVELLNVKHGGTYSNLSYI